MRNSARAIGIPVCVHQNRFAHRIARHSRREAFLRKQDVCTRFGEHERQAFLRTAGLNREICGSSLEYAEKRDKQLRQTEGARAIEEAWMESERRYNARRREEMRAARVEYHSGQVVRLRAVLESLIAGHEEQVAKLMEGQTKGVA